VTKHFIQSFVEDTLKAAFSPEEEQYKDCIMSFKMIVHLILSYSMAYAQNVLYTNAMSPGLQDAIFNGPEDPGQGTRIRIVIHCTCVHT